jgi:ADP-ribose pyrophosphatase YjhB (NUDIX family)
MSLGQDRFFRAVASRQIPRIRIAAIVVSNGRLLVQRPTDDPSSFCALVGGEYELGDTFEARLRKEFQEETNARIVEAQYLFCVENHFRHNEDVIQQVEHVFLVTLDRQDVISREPRLTQYWLPVSELDRVDLRPVVVRNAITQGSYLTDRYLVQLPA